ncbi:MAG: selenobiotic family radical SAM modification target peptide [Syntrophaceae bacterium]|nr:selenobiotic family radical SAM modification target peptide [Syntrophaceae bacterium]
MDKDLLKQFLAGLCITTLLAGVTLMTGCAKQATGS